MNLRLIISKFNFTFLLKFTSELMKNSHELIIQNSEDKDQNLIAYKN